MEEPICTGCRESLKRISELEAEVVELKRKMDEATRTIKRQTSPLLKIQYKPNLKPSGRKYSE